jgi:hypothetical protein
VFFPSGNSENTGGYKTKNPAGDSGRVLIDLKKRSG